MPERDGYIPGVPCWVDASEPNPEEALDFYGGLFGWRFEDTMPPEAPGNYFIARHEVESISIFDTSGEKRAAKAAGGKKAILALPAAIRTPSRSCPTRSPKMRS